MNEFEKKNLTAVTFIRLCILCRYIFCGRVIHLFLHVKLANGCGDDTCLVSSYPLSSQSHKLLTAARETGRKIWPEPLKVLQQCLTVMLYAVDIALDFQNSQMMCLLAPLP
jgi:hypothetical protein